MATQKEEIKKESEVIGRDKHKEGYVESPTGVYLFCNLSMNFWGGRFRSSTNLEFVMAFHGFALNSVALDPKKGFH